MGTDKENNKKEEEMRRKAKSHEYNRLISALSSHSPYPYTNNVCVCVRCLSNKNQSNVSWVQCFAKKIDGTADGFHFIIVHYVPGWNFGCHTAKFPLSAKLNMQYGVHTIWLTGCTELLVLSLFDVCASAVQLKLNATIAIRLRWKCGRNFSRCNTMAVVCQRFSLHYE